MGGMIVIVSLIVGIVLLRRITPAVPRWWQLGLVAALLQLPVYHLGWQGWLLRVAYGLLLTVAVANWNLPGGRILTLGLALNAIPIVVYGRMPISVEMLQWGQQTATLGTTLPASKDIVAAYSPLLLLGDSIPVQFLGQRAAWSIGDVVLCIGALRYCLFGAERSALGEVEPV